MLNQDLDVLRRIHDWLTHGHRTVLITVINTWGSAPRPQGSLMGLREDGRVVGSVSGGCIEADLVERVTRDGVPERPQVVCYGGEADEARRFGLPCGGTLRLVLEPLRAVTAMTELLDALAAGPAVARRLDLATGAVEISPAAPGQGLAWEETHFTQVLGSPYRLLIIGAGPIAAILARIALGLDFAVTVCDPREEYGETEFGDEMSLIRTMPDDTVIAMRPDAHTAVVALTHDPKLDDLALLEALTSPAFYVAALGSRANNEKRRERLRELGLTQSQVAALHGPAGLAIGGKTPGEIAVSIAAQLVAAKNNRLDTDALNAQLR